MPQAMDLSFANPKISAFLPSGTPVWSPDVPAGLEADAFFLQPRRLLRRGAHSAAPRSDRLWYVPAFDHEPPRLGHPGFWCIVQPLTWAFRHQRLRVFPAR